MVYLIDDKKSRQELDYSWTFEKFNSFSSIITCIYTLEELHQKAVDIFSENNIILYHESFIDQTYLSNEAIDKRDKINNWSKNKNNYIVYFSGSKNTREIKDNIAHIPVSTLYSNLEVFLNKYEEEDFNLNYLLFGQNVDIEKDLNQKQDLSLNQTFIEEAIKPIGSTFFIRPFKKYISNPFEVFEEGVLFSDVTDQKFSEKINEWFNDVKFDNIFIPLCFGDILSDYNGLRLATHIRCSKNINQLTNIYIYAFVGIDYLLSNEYFDILKTKNIFLIPFTKVSFLKYLNLHKEIFHYKELADQIMKINLQIPKNYEDSHTIANEWAIYKWATTLNTSDLEIEKITKNINHNIYFKYLKTIFSKNEVISSLNENIKIKATNNPKVLYIDDEAHKGWFEIFCKLLVDLNNIDFELLNIDYHNLSQDEIVTTAINYIKNNNIDLIILDFRLHHDDFINKNINDVTGLKILKEIKKFNYGIQVVIFSATNKLWNLQALQNLGADGFIMKESPDSIYGPNFTEDIIKNFIKLLDSLFKKKFLKTVFEYCKIITANLNECEYDDHTPFSFFIKDLKRQIYLITESSKGISLKQSTTLDIVFLNCYNFLEKFKHFYTKELNGKFLLGDLEVEMKRYSSTIYQYQTVIEDKGSFYRHSQYDNPSWFNVITSLFIDYFEISKIDSLEIEYLNRIKDKRNDYIHYTKSQFDQNELLMIFNLCEKITKKIRE